MRLKGIINNALKPFTARFSQEQISSKVSIFFILWNFEKQIAQCESTTEEVSFEWSHHKISSADLRVKVTLQNSIEHSGSERVKHYVGLVCRLCNHKVSFAVNCNISGADLG